MKTFIRKALALSFLVVSAGTMHAQIISTVAGNGVAAYGSDNVPATATPLNEPHGVAFDAFGNMYIADALNHRVRKVDAFGVITTIAGNGTAGNLGDGGPATAAELRTPYAVAFDHSGNLYVGDLANCTVRKITPSGTILPFAGLGGIGNTGDGGPATAALLGDVSGVAVDANDNVYITLTGYNCVRKVDAAGIITTVAGTGVLGFSGDGGPATAAKLNTPHSVAFDAAGNMYIADQYNCRVRKVSTGGIITTVVGSGTCGSSGNGGPATAADITNPTGITFDAAGNMYVACYNELVVRKVDPAGIISAFAGVTYVSGYNGDDGIADTSQLNYPYNVAAGPDGNIYIADQLNNRIRKVTSPPCTTVHAGTVSSIYGDTICTGESALLNTNAMNAGSGFMYLWQFSPDGVTWFYGSSTAPGYLTDPLTAVRYYRFIAMCPAAGADTSAAIAITPVNSLVPSVTITASPGVTISVGVSDTFRATVVNGGTTPAYQWIKNGVPIPGAVNSAYITDTLADNDTISCIVHSSVLCTTPDSAISNMQIIHLVPDGISQAPNYGSKISIYPNPGRAAFHVAGSVLGSDISIQVYNATGTLVYTTTASAAGNKMDALVSLPATCADGIYTVRIRSGSQTEVLLFSLHR